MMASTSNQPLLQCYEALLVRIRKRGVFGRRPELLPATAELEQLVMHVKRDGDSQSYEVLLHKALAECHMFLTNRLLEAQAYLDAGRAAARAKPDAELVFFYTQLHLEVIPFYLAAAKIFHDHAQLKCLTPVLYYELASILVEKQEPEDAIRTLWQAMAAAPAVTADKHQPPQVCVASAELIVETAMQGMDLNNALAGLQQLCKLHEDSKQPSAQQSLTTVQISTILMLTQLRNFVEARKVYNALAKRHEGTRLANSPLLALLSLVLESKASDQHQKGPEIRNQLKPLLNSQQQRTLDLLYPP